MSEFILELYSEEIPPNLQINARNDLETKIRSSLIEENLKTLSIKHLSISKFSRLNSVKLMLCFTKALKRVLFSFVNNFTFSIKWKLFFMNSGLLIKIYKNENSLSSIEVNDFVSL